MNRIDAFFTTASLLLIWIFAVFLIPGKIMAFVYVTIAGWAVGTSIINFTRKLAKETDNDFLNEMFRSNKELVEIADAQLRTMQEMLAELKRRGHLIGAAQATIDQLMFEYCPEEMTEAQIANYEAHVGQISQQQEDEIEKALRH